MNKKAIKNNEIKELAYAYTQIMLAYASMEKLSLFGASYCLEARTNLVLDVEQYLLLALNSFHKMGFELVETGGCFQQNSYIPFLDYEVLWPRSAVLYQELLGYIGEIGLESKKRGWDQLSVDQCIESLNDQFLSDFSRWVGTSFL